MAKGRVNPGRKKFNRDSFDSEFFLRPLLTIGGPDALPVGAIGPARIPLPMRIRPQRTGLITLIPR